MIVNYITFIFLTVLFPCYIIIQATYFSLQISTTSLLSSTRRCHTYKTTVLLVSFEFQNYIVQHLLSCQLFVISDLYIYKHFIETVNVIRESQLLIMVDVLMLITGCTYLPFVYCLFDGFYVREPRDVAPSLFEPVISILELTFIYLREYVKMTGETLTFKIIYKSQQIISHFLLFNINNNNFNNHNS